MDIEKRNLLMLEHQPLVAARARYFMRKISTKASLTVEDLIAQGQIGLIKGIESFDDTRGASLRSWLFTTINSEIREEIRRECGRTGVSRYSFRKGQSPPVVHIEYDDFLHGNGSGTISWHSATTIDHYEKNEQRLWILDHLWRLKPKDRIITLMYFYGDFKTDDIVSAVGLKKGSVFERIRTIQKKLKFWRGQHEKA